MLLDGGRIFCHPHLARDDSYLRVDVKTAYAAGNVLDLTNQGIETRKTFLVTKRRLKRPVTAILAADGQQPGALTKRVAHGVKSGQHAHFIIFLGLFEFHVFHISYVRLSANIIYVFGKT